MSKNVTLLDIQQAKAEGRKLVMVTAYVIRSVCWLTRAQVDLVLGGRFAGHGRHGFRRHR